MRSIRSKVCRDEPRFILKSKWNPSFAVKGHWFSSNQYSLEVFYFIAKLQQNYQEHLGILIFDRFSGCHCLSGVLACSRLGSTLKQPYSALLASMGLHVFACVCVCVARFHSVRSDFFHQNITRSVFLIAILISWTWRILPSTLSKVHFLSKRMRRLPQFRLINRRSLLSPAPASCRQNSQMERAQTFAY